MTTLSPANLDQLLSPVDTDRFLREYWNRCFLPLPGPSDRFMHLYSWESMNTLLSAPVVEPLSIRVVKNGIPVPRVKYMTKAGVFIRNDGLLPLFSSGAMVIINGIESTHTAVRELVSALERTCRCSVGAALCANWGTDNGFNLHWDDQDAFVIQIAGRKHWKVYKSTHPYPMWEVNSHAIFPTEEPVFDGPLETGSALYIPRGWWHIAYPLSGPSLHISIGVKCQTGRDLLLWFSEKLKERMEARRDIPSGASAEEIAAFSQALATAINELWTSSIVGDFFNACQTLPTPQPGRFQLPSLEV